MEESELLKERIQAITVSDHRCHWFIPLTHWGVTSIGRGITVSDHPCHWFIPLIYWGGSPELVNNTGMRPFLCLGTGWGLIIDTGIRPSFCLEIGWGLIPDTRTRRPLPLSSNRGSSEADSQVTINTRDVTRAISFHKRLAPHSS